MPSLSPQARKKLLSIAREAIEAGLHGRPYTPREPSDPQLRRRAGAFVTLHERGALRGCIGTFRDDLPLYRNVAEMARAAAFEDPRFPPLGREEFDRVDLEISVLTPMRRVTHPEEVEVGRHGLCVVQGPYRGVLLPQVAVEHGWDRETFLSHTCLKAGLPPDAWKRGAEILVFEAEVFGEKDASNRS